MSLYGLYTGTPAKRRGRKLPKRDCPNCGRLVSIMSNVTRDKLRDHKCVPRTEADRDRFSMSSELHDVAANKERCTCTHSREDHLDFGGIGKCKRYTGCGCKGFVLREDVAR